jgi:hypothetical protein
MARRSRPEAFGASPQAREGARKPGKARPAPARAQGIPEVVANRMARRIAITTGLPTVLGMAVFVASYLLVSRQILDLAPGVTLLASGGCFLLGLLGLSYGVFSSSWETSPGSLLGTEQIALNVGRLRTAMGAGRQQQPSEAPSGNPKRGT